MTAKSEPQWFRLGDKLMWQVPKAIYDSLSEESRFTATNHNAIRCSIIHLIQCLELSIESNRKGQHAVSMCLLRQCAEALTIIELGLLRDFELGSGLLNDWLRGKKKAGEIRKRLGEQVWPSYGYGLWQETWTEFIREFGDALHPYAHYTSALQAWQMALMQDSATQDDQGNYLLIAKVGFDTYDANKATRITLLHVLLSYVLGRVALANRTVNGLSTTRSLHLERLLPIRRSFAVDSSSGINSS
jgi:hypothetical protein